MMNDFPTKKEREGREREREKNVSVAKLRYFVRVQHAHRWLL